jgi:hypothetical protein
MTCKKALERWETKIGNVEVTPQAIWPIAKSLVKRDGPRAPTAIHGASGLKFFSPRKKTQLLTLWKFSSHHMICVTKTMNSGWRLRFKLYYKQ